MGAAETGDVVIGDELAALAEAYGVATSYQDWADERVDVAPETVVQVLAALGADASTPAAATASLAEHRQAAARRALAPTVVATAGRSRWIEVGRAPDVRLTAEDGSDRTLPVQGGAVLLPGDLDPGWYELAVGDQRSALVVAPERLATAGGARAWGWMPQLYSLPGAGSWGMGDYADLADLVHWCGADGAGVVLCNPLHAVTPVHPVEDSPYFPSSRRFRSALYLRPERTPEYAAADDATRARVDALRPAVPMSTPASRIDRDVVWRAKSAALEILYDWRGAACRELTLADFERVHGQSLADFSTFCALAERHGPSWRDWPAELRDPRRVHPDDGLAARAAFHAWLQLLCDEQLATAALAAAQAGMPVGVVHDLAVGVDPGGADAWALQDVLVPAVRVGAPPDSFNQRGQDWQLPPWHPVRLAEAGYAPFRDMIRSVLRHAGGIRIDHVMGLFRLWWVPEGNTADRGAYVSYDAQAMLAVLAAEAHRAGAVVVGEDLGTVQPAVREALGRVGVLGSDVAWFCRDEDTGAFLPPRAWRAQAMASVTTHDLPTVAGWLTDEPVRVRDELGQLGVPVEQERTRTAAERAGLLGLLRSEGLLGAGQEGDPAAVSLALHRLLVASPARLVLAAPGDAVGDLRQPNLPGTRHEYPNWCLPVADGTGRPLSRECWQADPRVRALAQVLAGVAR